MAARAVRELLAPAPSRHPCSRPRPAARRRSPCAWLRAAARSSIVSSELSRVVCMSSVISFDLVQEPGIDGGHAAPLRARSCPARTHSGCNASRSGCGVTSRWVRIARLDHFRADRLPVSRRAHRLHQCFLEGAADGHDFADRLHLRAERLVGAGELLELPLGNLDDDVIDAWARSRRASCA